MKKVCHKLAVAIFDTQEDPIALFHEHEIERLDAALNSPKAGMVDRELYPTIIEKAAILYYTLNKNHPFKNGNKRISATSLLVFLMINDKWLMVKNEELYQKTLDIAKSERTDKEEILTDIKLWIGKNMIPLSEFIKNAK